LQVKFQNNKAGRRAKIPSRGIIFRAVFLKNKLHEPVIYTGAKSRFK
jgi:hypothetical protein